MEARAPRRRCAARVGIVRIPTVRFAHERLNAKWSQGALQGNPEALERLCDNLLTGR
jgi:hypothetical protein